MKIFILILLLLGIKLNLYSQNNVFTKYKIVFDDFNPLHEFNNEETLNCSNSKIKTITEYFSTQIFVYDTLSIRECLVDSIDKIYFYKAGIYKFDEIGRLFLYTSYDERGNHDITVEKTFKSDSIIKTIQNYNNILKTYDIYKLNNNHLPEIRYQSDENRKSKYYYSKTGDLIEIEITTENKLLFKYEFKYKHKGEFLILEKFLNGRKTSEFLYDVNSYKLLRHTSYDYNSSKPENTFLYKFNNKNKISKEVMLIEKDNLITYNSDITYLYNKNGQLIKEIEFNDIIGDLLITEYIYNSNKDLAMEYNYYLNNENRILGCIKFMYLYY